MNDASQSQIEPPAISHWFQPRSQQAIFIK